MIEYNQMSRTVVETVAYQRNQALDALAETSAILAATRAELEHALARVKELEDSTP